MDKNDIFKFAEMIKDSERIVFSAVQECQPKAD